ncbi:MAG: radical SAM protein [Elusimicrobia bacterium]|nr:radical SAM protein [Elusimicrobiota bacterium]
MAEATSAVDRTQACRELAQAHAESGRFPEAIAALQAALAVDPRDRDALEMLGAALARTDDLAGALAAFQQALDCGGGEARRSFIHVQMAEVLLRQGDAEACARQLELADSVPCEDAEARRQAGLLWTRVACARGEAGGHAGAAAALRRAAAGRDPEALEMLGASLARAGDLPGAAAAFQEALDLGGERSFFLRVQLAEVFLRQGDAQACARQLEFAASRPSEDAEARAQAKRCWTRLASALGEAGDHAGAAAALRQALDLAGEDMETLMMLGSAGRQAGDLGAAAAAFTRALGCGCGLPLHYIRVQLAELALETGDPAAAEGHLRAAARLPGRSLGEHLGAKRLCEGLGLHDLAAREFEKSLELFAKEDVPAKFEDLRDLINSFYRVGQDRSARKGLDLLLRELPLDELFLRNKVLNRAEFMDRRTTLDSKPLKLLISLTRQCNLGCIMCYDKYLGPWKIPAGTLAEIEALFPYLEYIQWRGGEVFLFEGFAELFDKAAAYPRLCQDLVTNGLLIDRAWARRLVQAGAKVSLSIDGITPAAYEHVRRGARFETLLGCLAELKEARKEPGLAHPRFETLMNFVVLRSNYREVESLPEFAAEHDLRYVQTVRGDTGVFPDSDPHKREDVGDDPEVVAYLRERLPAVRKKAQSLGVVFRSFFPDAGCPSEDQEPAAPAAAAAAPGHAYCRAPWDSLFVFLSGTVKPHCLCDVPVGNAGESSLASLWNSPGMREYRHRSSERRIQGFCSARCQSRPPHEAGDLAL